MDEQICQLSKTVGERLKARGWSITCAESCTGGLVAAYLTEIAGSSAYFERGFVTYSNQAKQELLEVSATTLENHGAVSAQTVIEMAKGALKAAQAEVALSISGIAGPDGGTVQKPVGTVWFGWASKDGLVLSEVHRFDGDRHCVRQQAARHALTVVLEKFL
ncbi:nicotinamide-nucleotide amidase [Leminorella grimontii]|uniref:nicotinamide-nucleotide amidase n=1 Tax=Leminorella grimontii TaxID=82981 RepID=UPI003BB998C2